MNLNRNEPEPTKKSMKTREQERKHIMIRGYAVAFALSIATILVGCSTEPPSQPNVTLGSITASPASEAAGIHSWQVATSGGGSIVVRGADPEGNPRLEVQFARTGDAVTAKMSAGQITFDGTGLIASSISPANLPHELSLMVDDVSATRSVAYDKCFWDGIAVGAACGSAILQGGLNGGFDLACFIALGKASDDGCLE